ncbi:MAG TPA: AraC family transcriptional regulator [Xanthobacteraceae bacterium]|nr:AraC family transcriptional regulator [Xanthobacteraceae bacterium]
MSGPERNTVTLPHRSALHGEGLGFAVTALPAAPYQVSYMPAHHVIGFTFERQQGVDAFGGARRRPFDAEPWRLAFTPAGCDVFSASDRGGEYLVLSVAPATFTRLAPGIATSQLQQFTNVADPLFTPLASGLRRAMALGAAAPSLAIETLVAAAVERVSVLLDAGRQSAQPERRMTSRRLKRILDHFEARLAEDIGLADLARDCGLSACYLARSFRAATGTTLHAALVERRIARARSLMEAASRRGVSVSLAEVAAATGFSSHAHMTTAFRRVLGITPSEWTRMVVSPPPFGPTDRRTAS